MAPSAKCCWCWTDRLARAAGVTDLPLPGLVRRDVRRRAAQRRLMLQLLVTLQEQNVVMGSCGTLARAWP